MELRDYLRIARRRWLLIAGVVAACVALAALITTQMTPIYASTARVFISTTPSGDSGEAYAGGMFAEQRVGSYADVLGGLQLSERVIQELDLDMSPAALSEKIEASVVPETVVLKVTVSDPDPQQAQRINAELVTQLRAFVSELETPPGKNNPLLKATVVDPPRLPSAPVSPQPLRNLALGLVLGLLLGLGLAVLRELLDNSVKAVRDVPALAEVPILAHLAFDPAVQKQPLISNLPSHAPRAEAYRILRTNFSFIDVDHASKAFVVTSALPGEGKSTIAINAAIAMAEAGQRVLLLDADLRRPQVETVLRLAGGVGLTTLLVGSASVDEVLQVHAESGLHVIAAGSVPPNPAELLQSRTMHEVLDDLRSRYDVIVIDAPPLLPVTDAAVLASITDGAVLVVRHGKTTRDQLTQAVARLESVESAPLGVILNMVPVKSGKRYGYGGYGYGYGYGYGPDAEASGERPRARATSR